MTSPSTDNFYAPLGDNPFQDESEDDSVTSPPLLSSDDPTTGDEYGPDTATAVTGARANTPPATAANTATMGALPAGLPHGTPVVGDHASPNGPPPMLAFGVLDAHDGPSADATPGSPASMMAAFRSIIERRDAGFARLLEQQRADFAALVEQHSTEIARSVDALRSTTNSNHGHVTKRLFPELEQRLTSLESSLASTASNLAAKGESLLASTIAFETRIATLEATAPSRADSAAFP
jgi:hypothetical protein